MMCFDQCTPQTVNLPDVHTQLCSSKIVSNQFYVYSTGSDVTDHVLVDDNPAYMTMKRIHLNKNSAYETVTQLPSVNSSV